MRHIIHLLTLLVFCLSCRSQVPTTKEKIKNDLTEKNLKGKIKSLAESHYDIVEKFGDMQKGNLQNKIVYQYNSNGKETENATYYESGSKPASKNTTKYDVKGNKIQLSIYDFEGTVIFNYKYDSKGNLTEESQPNFSKIVYKYNEQNKLIDKSEYKKYIKGFQLESKDIFKYDERGNQIEWASYKGDGSLYSKTQYKFDSNNNLIELLYKSPDGKSDSRVTKKYDVSGNEIEYSSYDSKGRLSDHSSKKYNDNGTVSESYRSYSYESDPNTKYTEIYRSDNNGNQIEYSFGTSRTTYKYEFDKLGNWLKKTEFQNDKATSVTERTIQYY